MQNQWRGFFQFNKLRVERAMFSSQLKNGLIFLGAFILWCVDRVQDQQASPQGRLALVAGSVALLTAAVTLITWTATPLWAGVAAPSQRAKKNQDGMALAQMDTRQMLSWIDGLQERIQKNRRDLQQPQQLAAASSSAMVKTDTLTRVWTGRHDPFEPLVRDAVEEETTQELLPEKDPLEGLSFTGTVGDARAGAQIGIFKVKDAMDNETTLIKKRGDAFFVNGASVKLLQLSAHQVALNVDGKRRLIALSSYEDEGAQVAAGNPSAGTAQAATASPAMAGAGKIKGLQH
jgi:hypothetical protein